MYNSLWKRPLYLHLLRSDPTSKTYVFNRDVKYGIPCHPLGRGGVVAASMVGCPTVFETEGGAAWTLVDNPVLSCLSCETHLETHRRQQPSWWDSYTNRLPNDSWLCLIEVDYNNLSAEQIFAFPEAVDYLIFTGVTFLLKTTQDDAEVAATFKAKGNSAYQGKTLKKLWRSSRIYCGARLWRSH